MFVASAREGRVTVVISAWILQAAWACVDPVYWPFLPRPTKGWPCGLLGPRAPCEASCPSGGPEGYPSPTSVVSSTSFLFIRALPKFSWCSEHSCSENRCVRWLFKIHRSREYEFGSLTHSDDFIPNRLRRTQWLKCSRKNNLYRVLSEKNHVRSYNPIYSSAHSVK